MLSSQLWIHLAPDMPLEWEQSMLEGRDAEHFKGLCAEIARTRDEQLAEITEKALRRVPARAGYPFIEPSDYEGIQKETPAGSRTWPKPPDGPALRDKLKGAWTGRIAGCLLGKPVEGYHREKLRALLEETGNLPLGRYIGDFNKTLVQGAAPVDDDTNYTVFAMKLIQTYGKGFAPDDVLEGWLQWIPFLMTCTAERAAYRNAAGGLTAPRTATHKNPYREWIGAQIRGDFYGYINIGAPKAAAEMAWRDASVSHVKNGIYGAMFAAALIAASAVCGDTREAVEAALNEIPRNCRLRHDIDKVLQWRDGGVPAEAAADKIHQTYDEKTPAGWCYTNPNAMVVAAALLYGEKDFAKTIGFAVQAAFDTDCNGATAGSAIGIMLGAGGIDPIWPEGFHSRLKTSVEGYETVSIDELAAKTEALL